MRKLNLLSSVLILFLLVPASITRAQNITRQKGLYTASFTTPNGTVQLYLPDDIRPGETISGRIVVEPDGRNPRQIEKNLEELLKTSIRFNGNNWKVDHSKKSVECQLPADRPVYTQIDFTDAVGKVIQTLTLPSASPAIPGPQFSACAIPTHALVGSAMNIPGPFDGISSTTQCTAGRQSLEILAESPRNCVVMYPATANGMQPVQVQEQGQEPCRSEVSGVDMEVKTGKLNLRRGESTFIDVKVKGLENLPEKATLTIVNLTPGVVTMTNGNTQVIPIWPPADTAKGTFFVHCPAVSITTGDFTVSINLELPENGVQANANPTEVVPPGYIRKSCDCSVSATVTKSGNGFTVAANGACSGQYGIGINTFPRCEKLSTTYEWSIAAGGNGDISGRNNQPNVTVRPKGDGKYVLCVKVTVKCIDGTECSTTFCVDQDGRKVDPPGTGTTTRPPTTPTEPKPPTTERPPTTTSSKCKCGCIAKILMKGGNWDNLSFSADVKSECTGFYGTGSSRMPCGVADVKYAWSIVDGAPNAAIIGGAAGAGVNIGRTENKPATLRLDVTVTCNDGTECKCYDIIMIPGLEEKSCSPDVTERKEPLMDGGLKTRQIGLTNSPMMPRDEFIALHAEGADWDQLVFRCVSKKPECLDETSEKVIPLVGRVKFEWKIEGEGSFVQLGCLPDDKMAVGDRVIFKPPAIPLAVKSSDTTVTVKIKLFIIDDGSAVADDTREKEITIRIKRSKATPDKYGIEITGGTGTGPASPAPRDNQRTCKTVGPNWEPGDNIAVPTINRPGVADNDKMVMGQWLMLTAPEQPDDDIARFTCLSTNQCPVGAITKKYPDKVDWTWDILKGGGRFVTGNSGRVVIYEANPEASADVTEVIIKVTVKNPGGPRYDPEKKFQEMVIKVYRPGIKLSHPPKDWLPTDTNSVELRSQLMYKDGEWKPALEHMCRIHYFELLNVSTEKGISLNNPVPKDADQCRDLQLKKADGQEVFDDTKPTGSGKCSTKELFIQSRTVRPEKEFSIRVHSRDFGAYGFLRSFGNINKKTGTEGKPTYVSIPVKRSDVTHPAGRSKKTEYTDNRVTVPHDIDENRMADSGWVVFGGSHVPDPANNNDDEDEEPVGDGFKGDGLSTYEEYRGFHVLDGESIIHQRTNYIRKDIFIHNEDKLDINLYASVSELDVHQVNKNQYVDDRNRVVNPNFNQSTHIVNQMGLHLKDRKNHSSLLGIALSTTNQPAIPNQEVQIIIYSKRIEEICEIRKIRDKLAEKIRAVVAHELLHGNNVCHHGEGDPALEKQADGMNGLRSGDMTCVMRYDNTGSPVRNHTPEPIGSALCTSAAGTGYNQGGNGFGNAAAKRGNCKGQIRVSGKGNPPKSCGNR